MLQGTENSPPLVSNDLDSINNQGSSGGHRSTSAAARWEFGFAREARKVKAGWDWPILPNTLAQQRMKGSCGLHGANWRRLELTAQGSNISVGTFLASYTRMIPPSCGICIVPGSEGQQPQLFSSAQLDITSCVSRQDQRHQQTSYLDSWHIPPNSEY